MPASSTRTSTRRLSSRISSISSAMLVAVVRIVVPAEGGVPSRASTCVAAVPVQVGAEAGAREERDIAARAKAGPSAADVQGDLGAAAGAESGAVDPGARARRADVDAGESVAMGTAEGDHSEIADRRMGTTQQGRRARGRHLARGAVHRDRAVVPKVQGAALLPQSSLLGSRAVQRAHQRRPRWCPSESGPLSSRRAGP